MAVKAYAGQDTLYCSVGCAPAGTKAVTMPVPTRKTWHAVNVLLRRATCDTCGVNLLTMGETK